MYIEVLKKTKYVYLADGTHMTHSDFHKYTQGLTNEQALLHNKEFADSKHMVVVEKKDIESLEQQLEELDMKKWRLKNSIDSHYHDWEKSYREQVKKTDEISEKFAKHARLLYKDLAALPILNDFQEDKGIKFIIQHNYKTDEYRFCFDPYQLVSNFHSSISNIYRENDWGTMNGGWMKVIGDSITLYAQSGDYGVYEDNIAIEACRKIFHNKNIVSYAGKSWNSWNDDLPF